MRITRKTASLIAALSLGATMMWFVPAAAAAPPPKAPACNKAPKSVTKLLDCVTLKGVLQHEKALQKIANHNGGNRASASSGYADSLDYVEKRLKKAGYQVTRQEFTFFKFGEIGPSAMQQIAPGNVTYVEGVDFAATEHSDPGDVTRAVTVVDIQLGLGNTSTSGCEAGDFAGFPAGNIALIQRGSCTFEIKGENAAAAGASGVLFFNQGNTTGDDRNGIPAVTLTANYTGGIPALNLPYALGVTLANTSGLQMRLFANVTRGDATTSNLIAESKHGDPHNVVMAGAHLDSVHAGPGINDNGSGASSLIEVAEEMAKLKLPNKLRFAWWGAEEDGLVGSTNYVNGLSAPAKADIEMYLNFDMVGSPNYGLFIYDGDGSGFGLVGPAGSDDIEALFERYYAERSIPSEPTAFSGRSDYQAFILNGIPSGGLFTGAEGVKTEDQVAKWGGSVDAYDHCYHSACDTIDNLNHTALAINADAIAYVMYLYGKGTEVLTP